MGLGPRRTPCPGAWGRSNAPSTKKHHLSHQSHFVPRQGPICTCLRVSEPWGRSRNGFTMGQGGLGAGPLEAAELAPFGAPLLVSASPCRPRPQPTRASGRQVSLEPAPRMQPGSQTQGRPPGGDGGPRLLQGKAAPGLAPRLPAWPGQSHSALSWSPRGSQNGLPQSRLVTSPTHCPSHPLAYSLPEPSVRLRIPAAHALLASSPTPLPRLTRLLLCHPRNALPSSIITSPGKSSQIFLPSHPFLNP